MRKQIFGKIKKTLVFCLGVCILVSVTVSAVSADGQGPDHISRIVHLSLIQKAANTDPARPQGESGLDTAYDVSIVEDALYKEGLLDDKYAYDGSYGTATIEAYKKWQRSIGSAERYCDGIPGWKDLNKLGDTYNFGVER